jgi:hypothetical protein
MYLLHRKPSRIALLEIDHSRDRAYPHVPQPRYATSSILTSRLLVLIPSWRNWTISLLDDILSFSLSVFVLSCCFSHTDTEHQSIYIEISHAWIGANTPFQPIGVQMHLFSPSSFGPHTDHINSIFPSWRLLMRIKSLHTDK